MPSLLDFLLAASSHRLFEWARVRQENYTRDPYTSKYINIVITDKCNLECIGCRGSIENVSQYELPTIDYTQFVKIVDSCIEAGISYFDLTPVMGELLLIKDIHKYFDYLETHKNVDGYLITTNGTVNNLPVHHKKINISISLYGSNTKGFRSFTKKNLFTQYINTFKTIVDLDVPIEITLRNEDLYDIDKEFKSLLYNILTKKNIAIHDGRVNDNRGGIVETSKRLVQRSGICPCGVGSGGAIRSDNKYYYCAFNDFTKKSVVGYLKDKSLKELRNTDKWQEIVKSHITSNYIDICKTCTAQW